MYIISPEPLLWINHNPFLEESSIEGKYDQNRYQDQGLKQGRI
mgnify:CR=1 FL=1